MDFYNVRGKDGVGKDYSMINYNFSPRCFQLLIESSVGRTELEYFCSICVQQASAVTVNLQLDRDECFKIPTYWHDRSLTDLY